MPRYLELLRAGGSRSPEELGAIVGIDLADPGFWDAGLDLVEAQLEEAEEAAERVARAHLSGARLDRRRSPPGRVATMDTMSAQWPTPAPPSAAEPPAAARRARLRRRPSPRTLPGVPEAPEPWWRRSSSCSSSPGCALLKFGKAALLLLPKAKVLTTSGTMLVSIAAYSLIWGWKFAVGFVLLLLVHEMGHVIQLRREGIEASAPMFIPFLGAAVMAKSLGDNATAEARVGLAGPILGTLGCLALLPLAISDGDDFWYALVFTGLFLNLFNLLPVVPLDGGRAMAALSPWMWFVGLFAMAVAGVRVPEPDHHPHPAARRLRDVQALEGAQGRRRRGRRVLQASSPRTGSRSLAVYLGPDRRLRRSAWS